MIEFDWYHKSTFSGRCLNFLSPDLSKERYCSWLVDRVILLSNPKIHFDNFCLIIKILLENDYPLNSIFDNINRLKNIIRSSNIKKWRNENNAKIARFWFIIPYIPNITEKIKTIILKYRFIVIINCENSLRYMRIHCYVIWSRMLRIKFLVRTAMRVI